MPGNGSVDSCTGAAMRRELQRAETEQSNAIFDGAEAELADQRASLTRTSR